ncbi:MAG: ABC transporter substrate-binding protein [Acidimicrobiales bacterium]|nr:ABC transporter substrate-binding protein [Acidimicrobiales bacterium]
MNRHLRSGLIAFGLLVVLSGSLAACSSSKSKSSPTTAGGSSGSGGSLTVGSADFTESALLADIYADALQSKGVSITKKLNIGERSVYWKAMQDGSIDFIPEYNGSILDYLDSSTTAKSTSEVTAALPGVLGSKLTALSPAAAQDSDTITVTKATADKYHLSSIADLAPIAGRLTFGAPAQFQTRPDGIPALKSTYGVTFGNFTALSASGTVTVTSLKDGTIDAGDIFSTDPSFAADGFVALADPKNMFAAQNVTPIIAAAKLNTTIKNTVNAVSAKLTTSILADLDSKVGSGDPDPVAKQWLATVGLG